MGPGVGLGPLPGAVPGAVAPEGVPGAEQALVTFRRGQGYQKELGPAAVSRALVA